MHLYYILLSYKRKTWFEYAVGRNQKIVVVLLLLGTTPKILNWCYFDHVAIFICLHHCHYGIHSLSWELDGYILAKIVATSTEVICIFAEVLWGFISSLIWREDQSLQLPIRILPLRHTRYLLLWGLTKSSGIWL